MQKWKNLCMEPCYWTVLITLNIFHTHAINYFESTESCLESKESKGLNYCVKEEFVKVLEGMDSENQYTVFDDVILEKQTADLARILPEQNKDFYLSTDFRNLFETAGALASRRQMRVNLYGLAPGLFLHVGPFMDPTGTLEFKLDASRVEQNKRYYSDPQPGMARLLTNHLLVPLLLGLKLNLSSFLPLLFGALIILAKKSTFLLKIAFIISSLYGQSSFYPGAYPGVPLGGIGGGFGGGYGYKNLKYQSHQPYLHSSTGHTGFYDVYDKTESSPLETPDVQDKFYEYEKNQLRKTKALSFSNNNQNFFWQTAKK